MPKYTKRSAAAVTAGVLAVTGGAAWAYWEVTGSGSSSASAGTSVELDVIDTSIALTPDTFYPGSTHNVTFTVSNPNEFPIKITGFGIENITSSNETACPAATNIDVLETVQAPTAAELAFPATSGERPLTYTGAIKMVANAANGCKNVSFDFDIELDAQSNAS